MEHKRPGTGAVERARARRQARPAVAIVSGLVLAMGIVGCSETAPDPATHTVTVRSFEFVPPELTVRAGDTIVWTNEDAVPHTATAAGGAWDTGSIEGRGSGTLALETPGTHEYVCAFHPTMTGVVTVE